MEAVEEERLTALATQIAGQRTPKSRAAETDLVLVALWSSSADQFAAIEEELTQRGFARETTPGFMGFCQAQANERNLQYKGDLSAWSIPAMAGESHSQTPVVFDEALRAIRRRMGVTSSISVTVPSEMICVMRWSPEEMLDHLRKSFHETPADTGELRRLVETLVKHGHIDEAVRELARIIHRGAFPGGFGWRSGVLAGGADGADRRGLGLRGRARAGHAAPAVRAAAWRRGPTAARGCPDGGSRTAARP